MLFILSKDKNILGVDGPTTYIEAGEYEVVRLFDRNRVLVDVNNGEGPRQLTLLSLSRGRLYG